MGKKTIRLLPGERIESKLRPHPLSFGGSFALALWPALWAAALAWIVRTSWWADASSGPWYQFWTFLYGNAPAAYVLTLLGLAAVGIPAAVVKIRWSIPLGYAAAGLAAIGLTIWLSDGATGYGTWLPGFLAAASIPAAIGVEGHRRSHRFILTNLRILFMGGVFVRHERQMRYEAVTDLDGSQGLFGRLFGFGTIIPVTQSGFGLGADTSQAGIAVGGGASKAGIMGGVAVGAGGGREVQTGRARSFHQLTGVRPYRDTKHLLESLIQAATSTPYLREQVDLQRRMVAALERVEGAPPQRPPSANPAARPRRD
ncbi:MAG: PH domain-containing protein [Thermoplasmatota archaeon]